MDRLDWIHVGFQADCIIGTFSEERTESQPLVVNVSIGLSTRSAGSHQRLDETVDYLSASGQVKFLLIACRFRLMETAAEAVASYLLAPPALGERRAQIDRVVVEMQKPRAMAPPATARLVIDRTGPLACARVEEKEFGTVDIIFETTEWGIYRLNIAPGKRIPLHVHDTMREEELILTEGLVAQGRVLRPGTAFRWPRRAAHEYVNPTQRYQTILCINSPPFIADDEIDVSGEPAEVRAEHFWPPRGPDGWSRPPGT